MNPLEWLKNRLEPVAAEPQTVSLSISAAERLPKPFAFPTLQDQEKYQKARLFLVSLFLEPRFCSTITGDGWNQIWQQVLGESPKKTLADLKQSGWLVLGTFDQQLDSAFTVPELKRFCKMYQLPVSGKKADLVKRLVEQGNRADLASNLQQIEKGEPAYTCSELSRPIAEKVKYAIDTARCSAEISSLHALESKQYEIACRTVLDFEKAQIFPRGVGMDWQSMTVSEMFGMIRPIVTGKDFQKATTREDYLMIVTGIWCTLWGKSEMPKYLLELMGFTTIESRRTAKQKSLETNLQSARQRTLQSYREMGVLKVAICASRESCKAAQMINNRAYSSDQVPNLPLPKCDRELPCNCCYISADRQI